MVAFVAHHSTSWGGLDARTVPCGDVVRHLPNMDCVGRGGGTQPRRNLPTCLKGLGISPKSAAVERLAGTCKNRVISFGKAGTETVGRQSDNKHHRRITTQSSDSCGIDLSVCAAAGDLRRVLCTHPTSRLRQCCANGAEHHGAR